MSDTSPRDQSALFAGAGQAPARQATAAEPLFAFVVGDTRYRCELRAHVHGVEAQFYQNDEFFYSRAFDQRLDPSRPARELAIAWATAARDELQRRGAPSS